MKITRAESCINAEKELKDNNYSEALAVYIHNEQKDKTGLVLNPDIKADELLLCCSRLNQVVAKMVNISYDDYLRIMKGSYSFTNRVENLNLSEEQLEKMIEKDIRGFKL